MREDNLKPGRKHGARGKGKHNTATASLSALKPRESQAEGRPSRVVRTHAAGRALDWWADLDPKLRAEVVEGAYLERHSLGKSLVTVRSSEDYDYAD